MSWEQQEAWITMLIWASDFYFLNALERQAQASLPRPSLSLVATNKKHELSLSDQCIDMEGWLTMDNATRYYCLLSQGTFSTYACRDNLRNEWSDAVHAIQFHLLKSVQVVNGNKFILELDTKTAVLLEAESQESMHLWMLKICHCSNLVLKDGQSMTPKEGHFFILKNYDKKFL